MQSAAEGNSGPPSLTALTAAAARAAHLLADSDPRILPTPWQQHSSATGPRSSSHIVARMASTSCWPAPGRRSPAGVAIPRTISPTAPRRGVRQYVILGIAAMRCALSGCRFSCEPASAGATTERQAHEPEPAALGSGQEPG